MKEVKENGPFFGVEEALEVDEGVQLKEGLPPPKRVNIQTNPFLIRLCVRTEFVWKGKG